MTVLILGVSTRAIAQSATRASYDVRTIDFFGDRDQERCCPNLSLRRDLQVPFSAWELFRAALRDDAQPVDGVVYLANLENHPDVIAALATRFRVLGNASATVASVRNWETLAASVNGLGFATPRTLRTEDAPSERRWLSKPRRSGGGAGIRPWQGEPLRRGRIVQEYVEGPPCSVTFAADGKRAIVLAINEQLIGRREFGATGFQYCGNILPLAAGRDPALADRLQVLVDGLVRDFGLVGVGGVDFVLADEQPVILEVNPRYTGSMELIERATGLSVFETHLHAIDGMLPETGMLRAFTGYWGKAIVFASRPIVMADHESWLERGLCDVPHAGDRIEAGQPVCTVMAQGTTRELCLAALAAGAKEVYRELDG